MNLLVLGGCAPRQVALPSPLPSADDVIKKIGRADAVHTLRAWGTSKWKRDNRKGSAEVAIILQRPDRFRLEGLSPLGSSLYSLVIQGEELLLFVPSEKRVYRGAASPRLMARLFSLPLKAEEALGVLSGRVPLCRGRDKRVYGEGDRLILEMICEPHGWLQKVPLDPRNMDPMGFQLQDPSGQEILVVTWKDFQREGEARVPTEILVEMPSSKHMLRFRIDELEINAPIPQERFQLILPPDTEVQPFPS